MRKGMSDAVHAPVGPRLRRLRRQARGSRSDQVHRVLQRRAGQGDLPAIGRDLEDELVPVMGGQRGVELNRARLSRLAPDERGSAIVEGEGPARRRRGVPGPQHGLVLTVERHGAVADPVGAQGPAAIVTRERREDGCAHLEARRVLQQPGRVAHLDERARSALVVLPGIGPVDRGGYDRLLEARTGGAVEAVVELDHGGGVRVGLLAADVERELLTRPRRQSVGVPVHLLVGAGRRAHDPDPFRSGSSRTAFVSRYSDFRSWKTALIASS